MTGDWLGKRSCLAEHGIEIESFLTQFYQGVASGGAEQIFRYGAKFDLLIDFDTEEMGLWRGGKVTCHAAEWQFGQNSIADAAFLAPVNPFALTAAVTVEGFGYFASRPDDRMGIGYFYSGLSDDFRNLVSAVEPIGELHGAKSTTTLRSHRGFT